MKIDLSLQNSISVQYKSNSQKARVLTEEWVKSQVACPGCGGHLQLLPANTKAADFRCEKCGELYQLKSQAQRLKHKILGAEFTTTVKSIQNDSHPSLILMHYDPSTMMVNNLEFVHKSWITISAIIPRKPLGPTARRAGWQGCHLDLDQIPLLARIHAISEGTQKHDQHIRDQWLLAQSIAGASSESRGWISDVLQFIDKLPIEFSLQDVYRYETELAHLHPNNHNVRAKIRQQLQVARDHHYIVFQGNGQYRKLAVAVNQSD